MDNNIKLCQAQPKTVAEWIITSSILLSYPIYFTGLMFPVNTMLPWLLLVNVGVKFWQQSDQTSHTDRRRLHLVVWLWIIAVVTILVALLIGLTDFNYDTREIVRSLWNWSREWALYPLCLTLGCCLNVRPQVIYRAVCQLCAQSLVMLAVCGVSAQLKLPGLLYNSPIERITQNGKLFYEVRLYLLDPDSGGLRFNLFAPWPPALGLLACIYFLMALQESHRGWKIVGMIGSIAMLVASVSRGALLFLPSAMLLTWIWTSWNRVYLQLGGGAATFVLGLLSYQVSQLLEIGVDRFVSARKSSSQLRDILQRLALERWAEAPIWGHGKQIAGPALLKGMPLGSHHTWIGLLFSHGIVGCLAVLVAMGMTLLVVMIQARRDRLAKTALAILLVIIFTSFGENIEKLAYLVWPALVLIGMVFRAQSVTAMPDTKSRNYGDGKIQAV
jgi:hypothetical protein